ncbi:hypothetical protein BGX33_004842 [Mortierella sp. NVP41]|nr:hypothetical protein BGX33_004842 [Mortierella sp. NVP41]
MAYLRGDEFQQLFRSYYAAPAFASHFRTEADLLLYARQIILYRETIWILAKHTMEQLQSLALQVSDIARYADVVHRMEKLENISFLLDENWSFSNAATSVRKDETLRSMVRLVKDHVRLFPGRLKTMNWYDRGIPAGMMGQSIPEEVQLEILRALPPVQRLGSLTADNWMKLAAHPETTELRYLERIHTDMPADRWFGSHYDYRQLLQRCRGLYSLKIPALGQGSFNWAVQEKRSMESLDKDNILNNSCSGSGLLSDDGSRPAHLEYGLVPLSEVALREYRTPFTDEIDDIAFAFSNTLTIFQVTTSKGLSDLPRTFHIGQGWVDLPKLTRLEINVGLSQLMVHPDLLGHCPNVINLRLADGIYDYSCQDIMPCSPASLANLEDIYLRGWSALTFHPDTLHSTTKLIRLILFTAVDDDDVYYIPPLNELNWSYGLMDNSFDGTEFQNPPAIFRPRWTWDWHLPHLKTLRLSSEFAYHFRFEMLLGCPVLEWLSLNIRSSDAYGRTICQDDMFGSSIKGDISSPQRRIISATLLELAMYGRWIMDDDRMHDFLSVMAPNLEVLVMDQWEGMTLGGLVRMVRTLPNTCKAVHTSLPQPSDESMKQLGMLCATSEFDREGVLPVAIYFYDNIFFDEFRAEYYLSL